MENKLIEKIVADVVKRTLADNQLIEKIVADVVQRVYSDNRLIDKIVSDVVQRIPTKTLRKQRVIKNLLVVNNKLKTFGIITAENPMDEQSCSQENEIRNKKLHSLLRSRQYVFCPVEGRYGNVEHSFMICNVSLEDMKEIGREFDQKSFIYAEINSEQGQPQLSFSYFQKLKPRGEYRFVEKNDVYTSIDAEADEFFTATGRNFKFTIPFDMFNEAVEYYNNFVNERCQKHEEYDNYCEMLINESIQANRTGMGRRIRRAQLYGTHYETFLNKEKSPTTSCR